jgi:hypothetical protein
MWLQQQRERPLATICRKRGTKYDKMSRSRRKHIYRQSEQHTMDAAYTHVMCPNFNSDVAVEVPFGGGRFVQRKHFGSLLFFLLLKPIVFLRSVC